MKLFVAIAIFLAAVHCALAASISPRHPSWSSWKKLYNKQYTPSEEARREANYEAAMARADEMQAKNPQGRFGHNEYSDLSVEEFRSVYHNAAPYFNNKKKALKNAKLTGVTEAQRLARPQSINWNEKGAVTYIKNQGQCGSCWSFSTTGGIEGQWFLAGHPLVALSEQELVSCDHTCNGCQGGLMDDAFEWIVSARDGWITGENDYPYVSGQGQVPMCDMSGKPKVARITGHHDLEHNEDSMATWLATGGPISIGVDASSWQTYQGGIMTNCVSSQVDHGVLLVGYNMQGSQPYWIIKNSWGPQWGEQGFIWVAYGSDQCLITTAPSVPIASKGPAPPPGPTPPTPPTPPSPPTPSGGTFTQYQCPDFLCLDGCQGHTFPQGQCLRMSNGGSAIADCSSYELELKVYESQDCTGSAQTERQPLDKCLKDTSGTYIYNKCNSGASNKTLSVGSKFMMSERKKKM